MRLGLRVLGLVLMAGGFLVLTVDAARGIANQVWVWTSLGDGMLALAPLKFAAIEAFASQHGSGWGGQTLILFLLAAPASGIAITLGLLLLWLGLERRETIGYRTRG